MQFIILALSGGFKMKNITMNIYIRLIIFVFFLFISVFLHSQMIVRVDKESPIQLNLIENLGLNLCFRMEGLLVLSVDNPEILTTNNINFTVLTRDNALYPLVVISQEIMQDIENHAYIGEIVINESGFRVERLFSADECLFPRDGVRFVPVRIFNNPFRNTRTTTPVEFKIRDELQSNGSIRRLEIATTDLNRFDDIINSVNADSISFFMQGLEEFETRFALHPNRRDVALWISERFRNLGFIDVIIDSFFVETANWSIPVNNWQYNVIATMKGNVFPEYYVVVGAHHDSIVIQGSNPFAWIEPSMLSAPGADDNASGVAAVLEIARVMKKHNFQPRNSIRFTTFAIEELGLIGAYHDVEKIINEGKNVIAMINSDMISFQPDDRDWVFSIHKYTGADFLYEKSIKIGNELGMFDDIPFSLVNSRSSDSWAFHQAGIPAIFFHQGYFTINTHYHRITDLIENMNLPYTQQYIKLIASVTKEVSNLTPNPNNFAVVCQGTGYSVLATWDMLNNENIIYRLVIKNTENDSTKVIDTENGHVVISELVEDIVYEITLYSFFEGLSSVGISRIIKLNGSSNEYDEIQTIIAQNTLLRNYPNPFNPTTSIRYQVSGIESKHVVINVYNVRGQLVRKLVNEEHQPGDYSIVWDGRDDDVQFVSSGVYLYRMRAGEQSIIRKMLLLK